MNNNSFQSDIVNFLANGIYTNNIDTSGNINLSNNPKIINDRYVSYKLKNYRYNNVKIKQLYDVNIISNVETDENSNISENSLDINKYNKALADNTELSEKLNTLITEKDNDTSSAKIIAAKDTIINLRISLGQGVTVSDFSDEFPYNLK